MQDGHRRGNEADTLVIGLVDNLPPMAAHTVDAEITALLRSAARGRAVRLRHFVVPGGGGISDDASRYEDLADLWDARIDGLIVTGAEPVAASLTDEPSWPTIARLVDWAAEHTISTVWSCLAAQAAVYQLDGLGRQTLPVKLSGVFECMKASHHPLVSTLPSSWPVPHSRHNTLNACSLEEKGYQILSCAPRVGVDMFVKSVGTSLFVFMLGHPEYGPDSLLREYRRDFKRFIFGRQATYPELPESYLGHETMIALSELRWEAFGHPRRELLSMFDAIVGDALSPIWHDAAVGLYGEWLTYLGENKQEWVPGDPIADPIADAIHERCGAVG